jgi:hypothetical protein
MELSGAQGYTRGMTTRSMAHNEADYDADFEHNENHDENEDNRSRISENHGTRNNGDNEDHRSRISENHGTRNNGDNEDHGSRISENHGKRSKGENEDHGSRISENHGTRNNGDNEDHRSRISENHGKRSNGINNDQGSWINENSRQRNGATNTDHGSRISESLRVRNNGVMDSQGSRQKENYRVNGNHGQRINVINEELRTSESPKDSLSRSVDPWGNPIDRFSVNTPHSLGARSKTRSGPEALENGLQMRMDNRDDPWLNADRFVRTPTVRTTRDGNLEKQRTTRITSDFNNDYNVQTMSRGYPERLRSIPYVEDRSRLYDGDTPPNKITMGRNDCFLSQPTWTSDGRFNGSDRSVSAQFPVVRHNGQWNHRDTVTAYPKQVSH